MAKGKGVKKTVSMLWSIPMFPVLLLGNFVFGLAMSFFAPYASLFGIDEVGMSNIQFGFFMTIISVGAVVATTIIGKTSDRVSSRKKLLLLTTCAAILGYAGFAFVRNFYLLAFIAFFLLGTAASIVPQLWAFTREALKQSTVEEKETPFVMNVFRAFFALSWTVGPAVAGWVLYAVGFKGLFLCVSGGYLLAALALAFLLKDIQIEVESKPAPVVLRKFIVQPHILKNIIAMTCMAMAASMANLNMSQFITKVLDGTEKQVGLVVSVPPVFEVPFMIAVGVLATKIGSRLLIRIGFGVSVAYYGLLFLVIEPWQIYPIQILSAAQVSITAGIAVSYFQDFIPDEPGTATALYMNTTQIGNVLGFIGFGFFSTLIGYHHLYLLCTGLVIIGLVFLLSERGKKSINSIEPKPAS
ncbi:hypothetical protein CN918_26505 [Priestia megaterium]|nr:hypothetical protein CN918_26505 [Priestia megaterium]